MIEIELRSVRLLPAVLTRELVAGEDVRSTVADVAFGNAIESGENDDPGDANRSTRRPDAVDTVLRTLPVLHRCYKP